MYDSIVALHLAHFMHTSQKIGTLAGAGCQYLVTSSKRVLILSCFLSCFLAKLESKKARNEKD